MDAESLKDLNAMLMSTRDKQDLAQIRAAIAECRAGKMQEKKRALGETQVVGVTCASTRQETLAGQKFGILILDEMRCDLCVNEAWSCCEPTSLMFGSSN